MVHTTEGHSNVILLPRQSEGFIAFWFQFSSVFSKTYATKTPIEGLIIGY